MELGEAGESNAKAQELGEQLAEHSLSAFALLRLLRELETEASATEALLSDMEEYPFKNLRRAIDFLEEAAKGLEWESKLHLGQLSWQQENQRRKGAEQEAGDEPT